jgi:hypothetical protein
VCTCTVQRNSRSARLYITGYVTYTAWTRYLYSGSWSARLCITEYMLYSTWARYLYSGTLGRRGCASQSTCSTIHGHFGQGICTAELLVGEAVHHRVVRVHSVQYMDKVSVPRSSWSARLCITEYMLYSTWTRYLYSGTLGRRGCASQSACCTIHGRFGQAICTAELLVGEAVQVCITESMLYSTWTRYL